MRFTVLRPARLAAAFVCLAIGAAFVAPAQDRGDTGPQGTPRAYRPSVPGTTAAVSTAHPLASMAYAVGW